MAEATSIGDALKQALEAVKRLAPGQLSKKILGSSNEKIKKAIKK